MDESDVSNSIVRLAGNRPLIFLRKLGAVEGSNLETASVFSILQELEEWDKHLKSLPEVTHKLRQFAAATRGVAESSDDGSPSPAPVRKAGPRRSGPSL